MAAERHGAGSGKGKGGAKGSEHAPARRWAISVSILGTEVEEGLLRQQTVYYAVESAAFGQRGLERRTFEEFEALHAAIQAKLSFPLPELPPTFWYGNSAPDVVGDRRRRLEELLRRLVKLPEVLADGEESLLRFLGLPRVACVAVRFLLGAPASQGSWLQSLYETSAQPGGFTPLQDSAVEDAVLDLARAALADAARARATAASPEGANAAAVAEVAGGEAERATARRQRRFGEVSLCLDLLARAYALGEDLAHTSTSQPGGGRRDRRAHARFLLDVLCLPEDSVALPAEGAAMPGRGLPVRAAGRKALLSLARAGRLAWSETLAACLADAGAGRLLSIAEGRSEAGESEAGAGEEGSGDRLVVELLLRGLGGEETVGRLVAPGVAAERKRLLNRFFVSDDAFVRVGVGLMLARLVYEPSYGEAKQAELGLRSLYEEVVAPQSSGKLTQPDVIAFLQEDGVWRWLCGLADSPHALASGFVLVVIGELVSPSPAVVLETPGFHDVLVARLAHDEETCVRDPAARLLLRVYASGASLGGRPPELARLSAAMSAVAGEALSRVGSAHGGLEREAVEAQEHCGMLLRAGTSMQQARLAAVAFEEQFADWERQLRSASGVCASAGGASEAVAAALEAAHAEHSAASQVPTEEDDDALRAALQERCERYRREEAALSEGEAILQRLAEMRMALTREIAERDEHIREWTDSSLLPAAQGGVFGGSRREDPCPRWREELATAREEAAMLDDEMRCASEALLQERASLSQARSDMQAMEAMSSGSLLTAWTAALRSQRASEVTFRSAAALMSEGHGLIRQEAAGRRALRGAVRTLAEELAALDAQLEALELQEQGG